MLMPRTAAYTGASHPVLTWTMRVLRAGQLAMLLAFTVYFVSVQVNAVAYLAGRHHPVVPGTTPPVPLDSAAAAAADITVGLGFEAIAVLVVCIAIAVTEARTSELSRGRVPRRSGRSDYP